MALPAAATAPHHKGDPTAAAAIDPSPAPASPIAALWPFIIISITYLLFTVTDGAVRMLVLLHAYNKAGIRIGRV
jgi:hypothetical protein